MIPSSEINLQIYDLLGNKVIKELYGQENRENNIVLDLSVLQRGIYFLKISISGKSITRKIVLS
ncbi:MAG: T9SS type A sorting domain-containing protein [Bacteroidales bacterium]|nr:T9SS type A sorting domain-containing protein [Bacteroidales bacterium]